MNSAMDFLKLNGKVALVTGGYGGIGQAVSRGLASMGAKVAITGRAGDRAAAWVKKLDRHGYEAYGMAFDTGSVAETQQMVDDVAAHVGRIDILVNCVGLNREEKAEEVSEKQFDYVFDVNLKGAMFQAQAAARHMIRQGTG